MKHAPSSAPWSSHTQTSPSTLHTDSVFVPLSEKVLVITILIKFLLLLVRHLFLLANIVTTSKALVTSSDALVTTRERKERKARKEETLWPCAATSRTVGPTDVPADECGIPFTWTTPLGQSARGYRSVAVRCVRKSTDGVEQRALRLPILIGSRAHLVQRLA